MQALALPPSRLLIRTRQADSSAIDAMAEAVCNGFARCLPDAEKLPVSAELLHLGPLRALINRITEKLEAGGVTSVLMD
ncbi:MAG: hypothetical protein OET44_02255 [Gammaproteobacteria bacterium]|nr:hypothetical protein [Gammaproteobacteria bacterium]